MINLFGRTERTQSQFIAVAATFVSLIIVATSANAAQLKEARVTQVIKDVKLLPTQAAPRPAAVTDEVRDGTAVRTGVESRAELTFTDQTLTRLGANTIFSFNEGTRVMNLGGGAMLFQVPKGAGGATIKTAAITAAITGTTGIGEFHPATAANPHPVIKWFCLEGTIHLLLTNGSGQSVELKPGQVEVTDGTSLPQPLNFDIATLVNTSLFFTSYDTPVASLPLIQLEEQKQLDLKIAGGFVYASLATFSAPTDFVDAIDQGMVAQAANQSPPPLPTTAPTPSKFGAPAVITSPDPFVITSGTTIQTDPAITTNGQTSFGKIWRGPAQDGPLSAFIFGSTSAFDTVSGFDAEINGDIGGAGFKFTSLQLTGNPTISTINGVINLGLIAVNGISSGGPGGTLTFAGIRGLLLATQNGSINLGSEISFSGLRDINFYARGSGSNLTLASAISVANTIRLFSEGSTQLSGILSTINFTSFSGGDFDLTTGSISAEDIFINASGDVNLNGGKFSATSANSEGNFDLSAGNKISITGGLEIDRKFGGNSLGLNLSLAAGTDLTAGNSLVLNVNNSINGNLDSGANVTLDIGGNLTINGGGGLTLTVANNGGGHIGTGGNILLTTGGDLVTTGGGVAFTVQNTTGTIDNGGTITLMTGGSVSTPGAFSLLVENFDETANPAGHIGTGGNISLTTGGNLSADSMSVAINNRGGGVIDSGANLTINIGGALTTLHNGLDFLGNPSSLTIDVATRFDNTFGNTAASFIGGDATLLFHSDSASIGGIANVTVSDRGGTISGNALLNFDVTHDLKIFGADVVIGTSVFEAGLFELLNDGGTNVGSPFGGNIHGSATIQLSAANMTLTAGSLDVFIDNRDGGRIGSNATESLKLAGNLAVQGDTGFTILNFLNEAGFPGGFIGQSATIDVTAANLSLGGALDILTVNDAGGHIGGNALIDVHTVGNLTTQNDTFIEVLNRLQNGAGFGSVGGNIVGSAAVNFSAGGNVNVGGIFELGILNNDARFLSGAGQIGGDANIIFTAANVSSTGFFNLVINNAQGSIGGGSSIDAHANSISTNDIFFAHIFNGGGGIGGGASLFVDTTGAINVGSDAIFEISNPSGTIGGDASLSLNATNLSVNGTFDTRIDNTAGTIQGNASMVFNTATALTSTGDQFYQLINADGGTIGGSATLDVTTKNLSSGASLFVAILNSTNDGGATGTVASNATLNFNVSGTTTVATDATFQINGSDSAASSAINFNGGTYNVGGTFEGFMDGSGTMTFNNATINADTVKAGVFGTNGVLNIGGGTLSANTELKLYAPGSKGQLNFIANVTLTSGTGTILAGATITIQPSVFVTIAGNGGPAQVFTNNANYRGFGGTNRNNGTFAGNGANNPQPLSSVPPFGPAPAPFPVSGPPRANIHPRSPSRINVTSLDRNGGDFKTSRRTTGDVIKASDSGELLSLLDRAAPGPNGKITIPASNRTSELRNSTRTNAAGRSNADRGAMNIRTASSLPASRLQR